MRASISAQDRALERRLLGRVGFGWLGLPGLAGGARRAARSARNPAARGDAAEGACEQHRRRRRRRFGAGSLRSFRVSPAIRICGSTSGFSACDLGDRDAGLVGDRGQRVAALDRRRSSPSCAASCCCVLVRSGSLLALVASNRVQVGVPGDHDHDRDDRRRPGRPAARIRAMPAALSLHRTGVPGVSDRRRRGGIVAAVQGTAVCSGGRDLPNASPRSSLGGRRRVGGAGDAARGGDERRRPGRARRRRRAAPGRRPGRRRRGSGRSSAASARAGGRCARARWRRRRRRCR